MRTQAPGAIRPDFEAAIDDVEAAFLAAEASIPGDANRKLIAEYLFVAMASLLEGFISDLVVAYINSNSDQFKKHLAKRLEIAPKDEKDEMGHRAKKLVVMTLPHLNVEAVRKILDATGDNVTFPTIDKMKESAGRWLAEPERTRFTSLNAQQSAVLTLVKKIRNFLAHRSEGASDAMQEALVAIDLPAELRRGHNNVADVGLYLRAIQGGQSRFVRFLAAVRAIAAQLSP